MSNVEPWWVECLRQSLFIFVFLFVLFCMGAFKS